MENHLGMAAIQSEKRLWVIRLDDIQAKDKTAKNLVSEGFESRYLASMCEIVEAIKILFRDFIFIMSIIWGPAHCGWYHS